jgi:hypothetical protein
MMKRIGAVTLLSLGLLAAANPTGVPKEAKEVAPGQYSYVDRDGKSWVYRKTPFGIQKFEDKSGGTAESSATKTDSKAGSTEAGNVSTPFGDSKKSAAVPVKITEDGDTLRFERQTPFGPQRWTRKKTELSDSEAAMWQAQRSASTPANSK